MAEIRNLKLLMDKLDQRVAAAIKNQNVSVVVGYTANYALYVHENIEMKWRGLPRARDVRSINGVAYTGFSKGKKHGLFWGPTGQAKFLEQPARELSNDGTFSSIIFLAIQAGNTVAQALLACGLRLQQAAMILTPVDTGNLRASIFCRLEQRTSPLFFYP